MKFRWAVTLDSKKYLQHIRILAGIQVI